MNCHVHIEKWQAIIEFLDTLVDGSATLDLSTLEETLNLITTTAAEFCSLCPNLLPEHTGFDINDDKFTPVGELLLELSPAIRKLRYQLVSRRLSENEFFSRLLCSLKDHCFCTTSRCTSVLDSDDIECTRLMIRASAFEVTLPSQPAAEWNQLMWQGRCKVSSKGDLLIIQGDDSFTCRIPDGDFETYVKSASDSDSHFVLKIANGRKFSVGLGFDDMCDASEFITCLRDFRAKVLGEEEAPQSLETHDYALKDGQTLTIATMGQDTSVFSLPVHGPIVGVPVTASSPGLLAPPPAPAVGTSIILESEEGVEDNADFDDFQSATNDDGTGPEEQMNTQSSVIAHHVSSTAVRPEALEHRLFSMGAGNVLAQKVVWPRGSKNVTFHWKVVVLRELTVDLEIRAVLRPFSAADAFEDIILQKHARGGHFAGKFVPSRDRRVAFPRLSNRPPDVDIDEASSPGSAGNGQKIDAVIFSFSNSFSWFTEKAVEVIILFEE